MDRSQAMRMLFGAKYDMAMQLSDEDEEKPLRLKGVGDLLYKLYDESNNNANLDNAIAAYEAAVRFTPDGHRHQAELLGQLGLSLFDRFEHSGDLADSDRAICAHEQAVNISFPTATLSLVI